MGQLAVVWKGSLVRCKYPIFPVIACTKHELQDLDPAKLTTSPGLCVMAPIWRVDAPVCGFMSSIEVNRRNHE